MIEMHGDDGRAWLDGLPDLCRSLAEQWGVELEEPFRGLTYGWVVPGMRGAEPVVLKVVVPTAEGLMEPLALKAFAGHGVVRLLEFDVFHGAMLLEGLDPGEMLVGRPDAITVACSVMQELWQARAPKAFPRLDVWTKGLEGPAGARLPISLLELALARRAELLATAPGPVLLHADLHHFNILSSGKGWTAIDPKGVVGEAAFECAAFLINSPKSIEQDIDTFARRLHLDRKRVAGWAFVFGVLSAAWTLEDHGTIDESALAFSEDVWKLMS